MPIRVVGDAFSHHAQRREMHRSAACDTGALRRACTCRRLHHASEFRGKPCAFDRLAAALGVACSLSPSPPPHRPRRHRSGDHRRGTFAGQGVASVYAPLEPARRRRLPAYIFGLSGSGLGDIADTAQASNTFADQVRAQTGAACVDLIGHSQGGLVGRYYIEQPRRFG